ncbi:hypothetical protein M573_134013 [Prevotella intermedia ZT]|uniref:Uncharacterized protein n=1 Tax=Prevotella intermedia ZT TaxID=1347790 RepID=A0AAP0V117_PREIN|nr:hypothetical protein [Prevotella intermedia]KJJ86257.1 hypothetical protein M573_134013 [Prevotella intermedia ZT]
MIPPSAGQVIWEDSVSSGVPFNLERCDVVAGIHERVAAALAHLQPAKINAATTTAAMIAAITQPGPGTHIQAPTAKVATPAMAPAAKATLPAQIKLDFV